MQIKMSIENVWQSCRWQHKPEGLTPQRFTVPPADLHKTIKLTHPQLQSPTPRPEAITPPSEVKLKSLHFRLHSKKAAAAQRVVIFHFLSGWLSAVVLSYGGPAGTLGDMMVRVFGPRQGRKTWSLGPKGPVVAHS